MPRSRSRRIPTLTAVLLVAGGAPATHGEPYNPYAVSEESLAPVAPDGTIQWGTFFKSAQLQRSYERLWNLGACRGTNKAITVPVESNKLVIDRLPEAEYRGVVQGASGTVAGGVVAFAENGATAALDALLFAQLHPAGVSKVSVIGEAPAAILRPGMVVRLRAVVDDRGRCDQPVKAFEIVTPPSGFKPDEVRPGRVERVVGTVTTVRGKTMQVRVDAGKVRRLTFTVAEDAVATLEAASLDHVGPGDTVTVTGRLWSGAGCAGAGTIFASAITITKPSLPPRAKPREVAAGTGGSSARPVE